MKTNVKLPVINRNGLICKFEGNSLFEYLFSAHVILFITVFVGFVEK